MCSSGENVIFFSVYEIIAYAVEVCIVVYGISVGFKCAWFEACIANVNMTTCMHLYFYRIVSSGNRFDSHVMLKQERECPEGLWDPIIRTGLCAAVSRKL